MLPSKRRKLVFQDQISLNAGQKYCRMLQGEHSAILLTFIKLPFVIKIFVLAIFERPFYTEFTEHPNIVSVSSESSPETSLLVDAISTEILSTRSGGSSCRRGCADF